MIDVANEAGADPWVNIPPHATDDYVHQFAKLAHQRLSPNLKLNLEYANEAWNYGFRGDELDACTGQATWPTQLAAGANQYYLELNWYAQRLAQVCTIARQEFGADASRVTCIANTQAALVEGTKQMLACTYAAAALGMPCAKFIDVVAIAPYFGYYIGNPTLSPDRLQLVCRRGRRPDEAVRGDHRRGPERRADARAAGCADASHRGRWWQSKGWMTATKAVADSFGLPMWAYEGGQHLVPPTGDTDATFLNLIIAANRDPRMGAAYDARWPTGRPPAARRSPTTATWRRPASTACGA